MKLKNILVLVALAGAVWAATAQGITLYGNASQGDLAPVNLVNAAMRAGGAVMDKLGSAADSDQGLRVLAGLALLAAIVRRSMRRSS